MTSAQLRDLFVAGGLPCIVESFPAADGGDWIVFEGHETDLNVGTEGKASSRSLVMQLQVEDPVEFTNRLEALLASVGWTYAEGTY